MTALTLGYAAALVLLIGIWTACGWQVGLLAVLVFVLAHLAVEVIRAWLHIRRVEREEDADREWLP